MQVKGGYIVGYSLWSMVVMVCGSNIMVVYDGDMAMGQNPVLPVNIPIPTKID